jgi:hypothetical protein
MSCAGLGPTGIGSVITDIETDLSTKGSEIIIRAGSMGGSLLLHDANIFTAGPLTLAVASRPDFAQPVARSPPINARRDSPAMESPLILMSAR